MRYALALLALSLPATGWGASVTINSVGYVSHGSAQIVFTVDFAVSATATAVSASGSTATITATNTFTAGQQVYLAGFTGATFLNGATTSVCGTGNLSCPSPNPTGTSFGVFTGAIPGTFSYSGADVGITKLSFSVARNRSVISPATCTSPTVAPTELVQPMEIGPHYFNGLTLNMDVAGLTPNSTYNICPQASADGGATWVGAASASVTTLALPAVHPALPIAPATFDPSYPNTAGFATYTLATDCSDIGTAYAAAVARQATQGTFIYIPVGTVCGVTTGNLNFASNPVDVNIWHSSGVNTTTGQITLGGSPTLTVGQGIRFGRSYVGTSPIFTQYPASTSCEFGQGLSTGAVFFVASVSAGNVVTLACNNNGVPGAAMTFTNQGIDSYLGFYWVPTNRTLKDIIIRSAAPDSQLPPPGVQITPAWLSKMATIQSPMSDLNVIGPGGAVIVAGASDGNYEPMISHIRIGPGVQITTVDSPEAHTTPDPLLWRTMYYSGPQVDNIVFDRTYWHNQPAPNRDNGGIFWNGFQTAIINSYFDEIRYFHAEYSGLVGTRNSSTNLSFTAGIENMGGGNFTVPAFTVTTTGTGNGEAFIGLDMTSSNALTVWLPSGMSAVCAPTTCVNKVQTGATNGSCIFNDGWQKNASGNPSVGEIACVPVTSGSLGSIIAPQPWASQYYAEGIQWAVMSAGPGPYVFRGNESICAGLCWHYDDGGNVSQIRGDYTVNRNYFLTPFKWMYNPGNLAANPLSDGLGAYVRQPVEWKGGRRIRFDGNVIDGNWNEVEGSAGGVLFTAVNGMGITDVDLTNNTILHGPGLISYAFNTAGSNYPSTPPVLRFRLKNNLGWDIGNPNFFAGRQANPPAGWIGEGPNASEDVRVENNSIVGNIGTAPEVMWPFDTNIEGVKVTNNVLYIEPVRQGLEQAPDEPAVGQACAGKIGKAAADCLLTPNYDWSNNLMIGNGQTPSAVAAAWPGLTNYYQTGSSSLTTVGWSKYAAPSTTPFNGNPQNLEFYLNPASVWKAGSAGVNDHGQDVGADINALNQSQGLLTLNGTPASGITTSGFKVSYVAPDSAACYVLYSTVNDITTATQLADAGGARARNTAVSGLAAHTLYFYWVLGQGNSVVSQRSGQVKTN